MPDIFDQLAPDFPQQEGDIFDQIAPDSDESSSARGASSISAPRSPVAAQSATSAGANPAPGSTAFAPQQSLQAGKTGAQMFRPLAAPRSAMPSVAPAAQAQQKPPVRRTPARQVIKLAQTVASPVQQQKPVLQQTQPHSPKQQLPANASSSSPIQPPNWRYISEHPEYGVLFEGALKMLYPETEKTNQQPVAARTQITNGAAANRPPEQSSSDSFRYARYANYQDKESFDDPDVHFPDPVQKEIMRAVYSRPEPERLRVAREIAEESKARQGYWQNLLHPYTPEEERYFSLAKQYKNELQDEIDTQRYLRAKAAGNGEQELARINQEREDDAMMDLQVEKMFSYPVDHPIKTVVEMISPIGDPIEASGIKGYPKYFKGLYQTATAPTREESYRHATEAAEGLSEMLNPLLYTEAGVKPENIVKSLLAQKLAAGSAQLIAEKIGASPEAQKFVSTISELLGGVGLGLHERLSAAGRTRVAQDLIRKNTDLVERLYVENKDFQAAVDQQNWQAAARILNPFLEARIRLKARVQEKVEQARNGHTEITNTPLHQPADGRVVAQVRKPVRSVHKAQVLSNITTKSGAEVQERPLSSDLSSSTNKNFASQTLEVVAPSTQLAAIANHSNIPPAQKHELMAKAILGELMPHNEAAAPAQAHAAEPSDAHEADAPVALMERYMEANGELPPRAESKVPSRPQISLDPEKIAPIGRDLAQLSHADRQGTLINLHDKLSQAIFEQGKILGPDGQLHVVSSPAEAAKLAQQIINDSIQKHDERAAENLNAAQRIASPISPLRSSPAATPEGNAQAGMSAGRIPAMGHGMTSDSPAVRRVKAEARSIRGQEPTVKVKQEPPAIQSALTQPPAPVRPEEAARIGQHDPESGRMILQPSNNVIQNERLANQAAPDLETRLSRVTKSVPGAELDRLRPQKGLERLQQKVADGTPPAPSATIWPARSLLPTLKPRTSSSPA